MHVHMYIYIYIYSRIFVEWSLYLSGSWSWLAFVERSLTEYDVQVLSDSQVCREYSHYAETGGS